MELHSKLIGYLPVVIIKIFRRSEQAQSTNSTQQTNQVY